MKRLILCADSRSTYSGQEGYWTYCVAMTEAYAKVRNIEFQCVQIQRETTGRHIIWTKLPLLRKYVETYDEILWLDTDATVLRHDVDVFDYIKTAPESSWKRHDGVKPVAYMLSDKAINDSDANTGIMLLDCTNKKRVSDLLNDWWNDIPSKHYEQSSPWDASVINLLWKEKNLEKASLIRVADVWSTQYKSDDQVFIHIDSSYKDIRLHEAKRFFFKKIKSQAKKIGIFVRQQNYYSNGAGQNSVFLRHTFESLGYTVDFLVNYDKAKPNIVADNIPYTYIPMDSVNYSDYKVVIFGSFTPNIHDCKKIREAGVRLIQFNPCNPFDQFHNENFIQPSKPCGTPLMEMSFKDVSDEVWLIHFQGPSSQAYLETLNRNKINVKVATHTWSPLFLYNKGIIPMYTLPENSQTLDIVIMEPNMGYAKSGWIPLAICERFYERYPTRLNKVYFFGQPSINSTGNEMIKRLSIHKDKKMRLLGRMPVNEILAFFKNGIAHGNHHVAFLSHQINVELNYSYFDALYTGFPFVHNSKVLHDERQGYYYDTVDQGVDALVSTVKSHDISKALASANIFLNKREPYNLDVKKSFETLLKSEKDIIQVVIICSNEERKAFQQKQMAALQFPWDIKFMDAFTPNTSKDYIVDKDPHHPENEGTLCCFRSHVAALEWFARASDKEYVIIIEDDIALLKENFVNRVNETIILWGKHKRDIDYVTLAYPKTLDYRGSKNDGILSWDFDKEHIMWGALVQMFPKEIAKTITQLLHKSTTKEVRGSIYNAVMSSSIKINQLRYPRLQTDALFPVFFKQAIIYPTCGMEVKFKSVISNNMNTNIWEESIRTNRLDPYLFWSDPWKEFVHHKIQIVYICATEERKAFQQKQMKDLNLPWPVHYFQAHTPTTLSNYKDEKAMEEEENDGVLCCTRSHGSALTWFANNKGDSTHLLILEDDVVLLNQEFVDRINQTITTWNKHPSDIDYVSVGYQPKSGELGTYTSGNLSWGFEHELHLWGTLGMLIKTDAALRMASLFDKPTTSKLREALLSEVVTYQHRKFCLQADVIYPTFFKQAVVYPPLIREGEFQSILSPWITNRNTWIPHIEAKLVDPMLFYSEPFTKEPVQSQVQIVILSASAERTAFQKKQMAELNIPWPVYIFPAYTPETSKDYIQERDMRKPETDGMICCMRSNIGAVEWYNTNCPNTPYAIIFEDDAALLKESFVDKVMQVIKVWERHMDSIDYVSLGYFPIKGFTGKQKDEMLHWEFDSKNYLWGCTAHLINRRAAAEMTKLFIHPNTTAFRKTLLTAKEYQYRYIHVQPDSLYPMYFRQGAVDQTMTMEAEFVSQTLGFNNNVRWQNHINTGLIDPTKYYSSPFAQKPALKISEIPKPITPAEPYIVTFDNDNLNKNKFMLEKTLDTHKWKHIVLTNKEGDNDIIKMRTYLEHLKTMDENTLVILTDSRSVLCCRPYTQFNKAFTSYGRDIVVGMEMFCDNLLDDSASPHQTCTPLTQYWKYNNVQSTPVRKYVNDGLIAGKAKALVQLFTFLLENKCGQLQMGLGKYMNTHPERVGADIEAKLFHVSGFGMCAGTSNIALQRVDSPSFAELFGLGAFFLRIPLIGKGQKAIYDSVCDLVSRDTNSHIFDKLYDYGEPNWL